MGSVNAGAQAASAVLDPKSAKRLLVVVGVFVLSWILYIDRAAISSAKTSVASELDLSDQQMGLVFSAFIVGYSLMQIPSGWYADRCGPRIALSSLVALWSLFTFLTGMVSSFVPLLTIRLLFGAAESGAFPGSARAFYNWLPPGERGLANGILFSGAMIGGGISFPICAWLISEFGWRWSFYLLALPGFLWAALWLAFFRDHPRGVVSTREVAPDTKVGGGMSYGQVFRSTPMMLAMVQYFAGNFTFYLGITWMLPYLTEQFKLTPSEAAGYAMVPLIAGAISNWTAGAIVDVMYRRGWHQWSRRAPGIFGLVVAAIGVGFVSVAWSAETAVIGFATAIAGVELTISPSWAYCMDIGGRNSGGVSGAMNMLGNFGGFASANAFPYLQRVTESADTYFYVAALLNLTGAACWFWMKPKDA